jgi:hypothetical protein
VRLGTFHSTAAPFTAEGQKSRSKHSMVAHVG